MHRQWEGSQWGWQNDSWSGTGWKTWWNASTCNESRNNANDKNIGAARVRCWKSTAACSTASVGHDRGIRFSRCSTHVDSVVDGSQRVRSAPPSGEDVRSEYPGSACDSEFPPRGFQSRRCDSSVRQGNHRHSNTWEHSTWQWSQDWGNWWASNPTPTREAAVSGDQATGSRASRVDTKYHATWNAENCDQSGIPTTACFLSSSRSSRQLKNAHSVQNEPEPSSGCSFGPHWSPPQHQMSGLVVQTEAMQRRVWRSQRDSRKKESNSADTVAKLVDIVGNLLHTCDSNMQTTTEDIRPVKDASSSSRKAMLPLMPLPSPDVDLHLQCTHSANDHDQSTHLSDASS